MTPEDKVKSVDRQIHECMKGDSQIIICPYCKAENNSDNQALCCTLFGKAVAAVLERIRAGELLEHVDRIAQACNN